MNYKNISSSASVKSTEGEVAGIIVNSHSSGTLKLNDGSSGTASAGVIASGTLTITDVFSDGEEIVIGDNTYTMKTALSTVPTANEVLIGASGAVSLDNLKSAINGSAGEGTTYSYTTVKHPQVVATTNTDTTQVVEYFTLGTAGNSIATTTDGANASWGGATLAGGVNKNILLMNTYSFPTGSQVVEFPEPIVFDNGLYATIGGTADITVIYR